MAILIRQDFERAIADSVSKYPTLAQLYQAQDPKILSGLAWACRQSFWRYTSWHKSRWIMIVIFTRCICPLSRISSYHNSQPYII